MKSYYLDTSALVKIYHREIGTETMLGLYRGSDTLFISELAKIELLSTVYRKYREHGITQETLEALVQKFEDDLDRRYQLIKFSSLVIAEAWEFLRSTAENRGLRTLDSLQTAFFKTYCDSATIFVSADTVLENLVSEAGFQTLIPVE
ncbi:type II toxin-antitoxin system VapC family toxin [Candidatus Electrothrix sp.]|uniref:type II toxin-antitoxin system VapC family toxin n=1 Tax=Candidatus Electrothrix sp. TaxID=2170559 RepID=UPI00405786CC